MENFLTVDGRFNCVTSHIKLLAWLEEKDDGFSLDFDHFRQATLEELLDTLSATVDWSSICKLLLDASICSLAMILPCKCANTLIGVSMLFLGHPYIGARGSKSLFTEAESNSTIHIHGYSFMVTRSRSWLHIHIHSFILVHIYFSVA